MFIELEHNRCINLDYIKEIEITPSLNGEMSLLTLWDDKDKRHCRAFDTQKEAEAFLVSIIDFQNEYQQCKKPKSS